MKLCQVMPHSHDPVHISVATAECMVQLMLEMPLDALVKDRESLGYAERQMARATVLLVFARPDCDCVGVLRDAQDRLALARRAHDLWQAQVRVDLIRAQVRSLQESDRSDVDRILAEVAELWAALRAAQERLAAATAEHDAAVWRQIVAYEWRHRHDGRCSRRRAQGALRALRQVQQLAVSA